MNNNYIKAGSDYAFNYTEHLVKKKSDKNIVLARIGIILLAVVLSLAVVYFIFGPIKIPQIAVVAEVLIIYLAMVLWSFTSIEYEYIIVSGSMSVDKIFSAKKRRHMIEFNIPTAEKIIPLSDARLDGINVISAVSSPTDEDAYCAIFKNGKGDTTALIFNAPERALKALKYYNKNCVIK